MRFTPRLFVLLALIFGLCVAGAQPKRIVYNNQQLFLSGANLAWMNFANDLSPAPFDTVTFGTTLLQMHDAGGNALRWWLHTNGTTTPAFDGSGFVIGPGTGTIENLRRALDVAWQREVGVILCLWSFDMLRSSNSATVVNRNKLMLTDTAYTHAYINQSLIPMVEALKGHPAIIAWEIFNEPEGMSNEFGWSDVQHVPMSYIQRFVNLCAGAIHRTDTTAQVTNGSWSFKALTDASFPKLGKADGGAGIPLTPMEMQAAAAQLKEKNRSSLSSDEIITHLQHVSAMPNYNYYSDGRLIAAGGDPDGILDFYSVHYYTGIDPNNPTSISPFHHPAVSWGLAPKAILVAEFAMQPNTLGVLKDSLFENLYHSGYAGGLPWSWTDVNFSTHTDMLAGMQYMWYHYKSDVDVNGVGGYWPTVRILSPHGDTAYVAGENVTLVAAAQDSDGTVVSVKFYADTLLIGEVTAPPFVFTWIHPSNGQYAVTVVATDNQGHQRQSGIVRVTVGTPPLTKREAEAAVVSSGITRRNDPTASGGMYLDMGVQTGTVTWTFHNYAGAGTFPIVFGYMLHYAHPKTQYLNVNGVRVGEVVFDGPSGSTWYTKTVDVNLIDGDNTIQMELYWGWMYLDYVAVPTNVLVASVDNPLAAPAKFALEQNYPNPFNPKTTIRYTVGGAEGRPARQRSGGGSRDEGQGASVNLVVYDLLGREVATLVHEKKAPGSYQVHFDGSRLSSGLYYYRLTAGSFLQTRAMILVK